MDMASEPDPRGGPAADALELVSEINVRLAQLGWPVVGEVESDALGAEVVVLRRPTSADSPDALSQRIRLGPSTWARPDVVEAALEEVRARGWHRGVARSAPRGDVLWCAPA